jgi:hypothetical protein
MQKQNLADNREKLNQLAEILLQKEVIFREDLEKIFGKRPYDDHEHVMLNGNGDTREQAVIAEVAAETTETTESADAKPETETDIPKAE